MKESTFIFLLFIVVSISFFVGAALPMYIFKYDSFYSRYFNDFISATYEYLKFMFCLFFAFYSAYKAVHALNTYYNKY